jgi:serine/threonine-protein kinase
VLEEKLGEGAMGMVFRATDLRLRRQVAIKILPDAFSQDPEWRSRFLREARLAAAVNHPNVATVYEAGEDGGRMFLALELVRGVSLRSRLAAGRIPLSETARIAGAVARALARAHELGVIHRDLKPENVLLGAGGEVKVLDFGLAKRMRKDSADEPDAPILTSRDQLVGTPGYMAPEQIRSGGDVDHRADLFAFGVMLYEMTTGRRPFGSGMEALAATLRDAPAPPRSLAAQISAPLDRLILHCLEKDPNLRLGDARDAADMLAQLAEEPSPADPSETPAAGDQMSIAPTTLSNRPRRLPRPLRHLVWLLPVCAGAVLLWVRAAVTARAPVAPHVKRVIDQTLPAWARPEAILAYRTGLQLSRDAAEDEALVRFEEAIAADPRLPQPHLRIGAITAMLGLPAAQEHLARVSVLRDALSDRDRGVFDAIRFSVFGDHVDYAEAARRLEQVRARFPDDAELYYLNSDFLFTAGRLPEAMRYARRGLELDPEYGMLLADLGYELAYIGSRDEALGLFSRCEKISPNPDECWSYRSEVLAQEGRCAEIERDAKRWIDTAPTIRDGYELLFDVSPSLSRPTAATEEVLRQEVARSDPDDRARVQADGDARLAMLNGYFVTAEREARRLEQLVESSSAEVEHASAASLLVDIYVETGQLHAATQVAADFLARRSAWIPDLRGDDLAMARDPTPRFLALQLRAGLRSKDAYTQALKAHLDEWRRRTGPFYVPYLWIIAYARPTETEQEARAALQALPQFGSVPRFRPETLAAAAIGRTYLLAGRIDDALAELQQAAHHCFPARDPAAFVRAWLDLGRARELRGDEKGACEAYKNVLARWGASRPRSLTAESAARRASTLGCGAP